jgi:hypothetical protein
MLHGHLCPCPWHKLPLVLLVVLLHGSPGGQCCGLRLDVRGQGFRLDAHGLLRSLAGLRLCCVRCSYLAFMAFLGSHITQYMAFILQ